MRWLSLVTLITLGVTACVLAQNPPNPVTGRGLALFFGATNANQTANFLLRVDPNDGSTRVLATYPRTESVRKMSFNRNQNLLYAEVPQAFNQPVPVKALGPNDGHVYSSFNKPWPGSDCFVYSANSSKIASVRLSTEENILYWSLYDPNNPGSPSNSKFDLLTVDKEVHWQFRECAYHERFNWIFILAKATHYHILALDLSGKGAVRETFYVDGVTSNEHIASIGTDVTTGDLFGLFLSTRNDPSNSYPYLVKIVFPPASGSRNAVMRFVNNYHFSPNNIGNGVIDHTINTYYALSTGSGGFSIIPVDLATGNARRSLFVSGFWGPTAPTLGNYHMK